ncbi:MAG: hypothetical protein ABH840_03875 [Nanoarchaeota archaeon]
MEKENTKLLMISAAASALDYLKKNPNADSEEVMKHVIRNIKAEDGKKIAGIAAANHVVKLREKNLKATQKQLMQDLSNSMDKILESIESQNEDEEMLNL